MTTTSTAPDTGTENQPKPVEVSAGAVYALTQKAREWSGWGNAKVVIGMPQASRFADCDHVTHTFTANAELLVLNPNRVLLTVTPFRLRQEAVLTGALLHEAGHARHTRWLPRRETDAPLVHGDGSTPTKMTVALARLLEEPRVEALMFRDADKIGAAGLGWTLRASAAHMIPTTRLDLDPDQQIMDLISSWALRAGRQIGLSHWTGHVAPSWVGDFTSLVHQHLVKTFVERGDNDEPDDTDTDMGVPVDIATENARQVMTLFRSMIINEDDTGTAMVDMAKRVLDILFPETDGDDEGAPMPSLGCESDEDSEDEESEQGDSDEGATSSTDQPEDQPEDSAGEDESDEQDSGEGEDQPEDSEAESGADEGEDQPSEDQSDQSDQSDEGEGEGEDQPSEDEADDQSDLAKALAELEAASKAEAEAEATEEESKPPPTQPASGVGTGDTGSDWGGWRTPTKDERETQRNAERFLREMISPTESSKVSLTESPSATVDGAALAAWRASDQTRDPRFFRRTRREVQPSPPVKIAILVDVSASMDELQKPSALLSWALASAAYDLRNFAGRGQQIESTLIHWGSADPRVIQRNGQMMPGIREVPCDEGTWRLPDAMALVESEIPGFFDITDKPVNRLLVQFTDWEMSPHGPAAWVGKALEAGVNMLSVVPDSYSPRYGSYDAIIRSAKVQRGRTDLIKYNPAQPERVWDEATKMLGY